MKNNRHSRSIPEKLILLNTWYRRKKMWRISLKRTKFLLYLQRCSWVSLLILKNNIFSPIQQVELWHIHEPILKHKSMQLTDMTSEMIRNRRPLFEKFITSWIINALPVSDLQVQKYRSRFKVPILRAIFLNDSSPLSKNKKMLFNFTVNKNTFHFHEFTNKKSIQDCVRK